MAPKAKAKAKAKPKKADKGPKDGGSEEAPAIATKKGGKKAEKKSEKKADSSSLPALGSKGSVMAQAQKEVSEAHVITVQQFARFVHGVKYVHRKRQEVKAMKRAAHRAWIENIKADRKKEERRRQKANEERKKKQEIQKNKAKLLEMAYDDELEEVKKILASLQGSGISIDFQKEGQYSALSEAAVGGGLQTVKFLISKNADINTKGEYGRTPLWRAAFNGHIEVIKALLEAGADPRIDAQGEMAIENASGECKETLTNWDISKTETLLKAYHQQREMIKEMEAEKANKKNTQLEQELDVAERNDDAAQKALKTARCSLEHRIFEYDTVVYEGKENLKETALSYVKNAEKELESAKEKADMCREILLALKQNQRESKGEAGEQQRPGVDLDLEDLVEVLWNDSRGSIKKSGKWAFAIDPSNQAQTFLRYRDVIYINMMASKDIEPEHIRTSILYAIKYGKPFVVDFMDVDMYKEMRSRLDAIHPKLYTWLMTNALVNEETFTQLVKPDDDEGLRPSTFDPGRWPDFRAYFVTSMTDPHEEMIQDTYPLWVTPDIDFDSDED